MSPWSSGAGRLATSLCALAAIQLTRSWSSGAIGNHPAGLHPLPPSGVAYTTLGDALAPELEEQTRSGESTYVGVAVVALCACLLNLNLQKY